MPSTARIIADRPVAKSPWVGTVYGRALIVIIVTADKQAVGEGERVFLPILPDFPTCTWPHQPTSQPKLTERVIAGWLYLHALTFWMLDRQALRLEVAAWLPTTIGCTKLRNYDSRGVWGLQQLFFDPHSFRIMQTTACFLHSSEVVLVFRLPWSHRT